MNAQKELLERIVSGKFTLYFYDHSDHNDDTWAKWIKEIAQAILDAGFVRLEDMEVFLDIIWLKGLMNDICMECKQEKNVSCPYTCSILPNKVSKAIASAKGLIKRKEGK